MAISFHNMVTYGLSGKIGDLVFRRWFGKTVVAKVQSPYYSASPAQQSHRKVFQLASTYAKNALVHPELLQFYQSRIKGGQRAYNLALADYLKPPVIRFLDTGDYHGLPGDSIRAMVTDDGRVVSVRVKIENADGLVEAGDALLQPDGLHWKYTVTVPHPLAGCSITVEARDLPGRLTSRIENL